MYFSGSPSFALLGWVWCCVCYTREDDVIVWSVGHAILLAKLNYLDSRNSISMHCDLSQKHCVQNIEKGS